MFKRIALSVTTLGVALTTLLSGSVAHAAPTTPARIARVQVGMTKAHVRHVLGAAPKAIGPAWGSKYGEQAIKFYRVKGGDFARVRYLKPEGSHHFYAVQVATCDSATWQCVVVTPAP